MTAPQAAVLREGEAKPVQGFDPATSKPAAPKREARPADKAGPRIVPVLLTVLAVIAAAFAVWAIWASYMAPPWTLDGRVRAYTLSIAPEVSGRISTLPIARDQSVHKGDLLMTIETDDYVAALAATRPDMGASAHGLGASLPACLLDGGGASASV